MQPCATQEARGNASFCCLQIHPLLSHTSKHFTPTEEETAGTHASINNRLLMPLQRHFSACGRQKVLLPHSLTLPGNRELQRLLQFSRTMQPKNKSRHRPPACLNSSPRGHFSRILCLSDTQAAFPSPVKCAFWSKAQKKVKTF